MAGIIRLRNSRQMRCIGDRYNISIEALAYCDPLVSD